MNASMRYYSRRLHAPTPESQQACSCFKSMVWTCRLDKSKTCTEQEIQTDGYTNTAQPAPAHMHTT